MFFFTSSNSSFTECVRTYPSSSLLSFSQNSDCTTTPYENCTFEGTHRILTVSSAFKNCNFTNMHCTNNKGGAICCSQSAISFIINSCIFESCSSIDRGGAVYVSGTSNTLIVTQSLFHSCITTNETEDDYPGGGGICMSGSSSSLLIYTSTFLYCKADVYPRGGGAFFASQIQHTHTFSSIFIS